MGWGIGPDFPSMKECANRPVPPEDDQCGNPSVYQSDHDPIGGYTRPRVIMDVGGKPPSTPVFPGNDHPKGQAGIPGCGSDRWDKGSHRDTRRTVRRENKERCRAVLREESRSAVRGFRRTKHSKCLGIQGFQGRGLPPDDSRKPMEGEETQTAPDRQGQQVLFHRLCVLLAFARSPTRNRCPAKSL